MHAAAIGWSHAQFWCSLCAEQDGLAVEELVDPWHFLVCYGGRLLSDHLHGPHLSLLAGDGHFAQVLPRDHIHRLLQV